jgi:hypothetical protein
MSSVFISSGRAIRLVVALLAFLPVVAHAQSPGMPPTTATTDSVTIVPGAHYQRGGLHRFLFGDNWRDLWTTPIRVPVLDLHSFGGGLRPEKTGGGNQTSSLHFVTPDGVGYVFRSVDKYRVPMSAMWKGTVVEKIALDAGSTAHPAGMLVAAPIMAAAGALHVTPVLVVLPDDTLLGKFRKEYAGMLGAIEEDPSKPKHGNPGFAGALEVIDSDTLLALMNRDPAERIDVQQFLGIRLLDMLLNDWDRGQSQWKWARFGKGAASPWEPIPRDRDKALITFSGLLPTLARSSTVRLVKFGPTYGDMPTLTGTSLLLDERLLGGLERPVWDSVAKALMGRITDSVIDAAVQAMPSEYRASEPEIARDLRARRDSLPLVASRFYLFLAGVVDIHATDAADRATIIRVDDDHVEVRLQSGTDQPYFQRVFDARETREIRVYLHGGDDRAVVLGDVARSIPVRIIGGNGTNTLIDSSRVGGHRNTAHFYDAGTVKNVSYGPDTLFNRRPQLHVPGGLADPIRDHGSRTGLTANVTSNHDFGILPSLGFAHYGYAFNHYPYASMVALSGGYSFKLGRYRVGLATDNRFENSPIHFTTLSRMSQLEVVNFHGYGNSSPGADTASFAVHQRQWLFRPAVALSLGATTDLSLGPVLQYSVTNAASGTFMSDSQPYGFGNTGSFGEASLRLSLHHDNRQPRRHSREGSVLDLGASYFPAAWDVSKPFEEIDGFGALYLALPVPTHPTFTIRGGGKKLFGTFPFQEAAFIGGSTTIRTLDPQRFAGDASLYASSELRIPVATLTVLVPIDLGLMGTVDYGRVYVSGSSPGGWHNAFGGGFWVGFRHLTADIRVVRADDVGRTMVLTLRTGFSGGPFQ